MSKRILVVEDEPDVREAMAEALSNANYTVFTAENGDVGLQTAVAEKPDLILLDIIMPVMDGHEFLRRLRQDPLGKDAKVIVLTAMSDSDNIALAHEGKIADYIIKAHSTLGDIVKKVQLIAHT